MNPILPFALLSVLSISAYGWTEVSEKEFLSNAGLMIADVPCKDVIEGIPEILDKNGIKFSWIDETDNHILAGPIISSIESDNKNSTVRGIYHLHASCNDEVFTKLLVNVELEALQSDNQWQNISDANMLWEYGVQFLNKVLIPTTLIRKLGL